MLIRKAKGTDIPEIVEILRASLGEGDLPRTTDVWKFKHVENPFGESLVLLAIEEEKIIGVRAFMRWQWQKNGDLHACFRAVDTATHPEHQGKGVFKQLTLKAIEIAAEEGNQFIFNTPNEKSRPGYLKMGWKPAGKLEVGLLPAYSSFWKAGNGAPYSVSKTSSPEELEGLCIKWNARRKAESGIFTPKTPAFLEWRYEKNPLQQYEVLSTPNFYLAVYVKKRGNIREMRIAECIMDDVDVSSQIKKSLIKLASKFGVQVISYSPKLLNMGFWSLRGNFGPILTFRELNITPKEEAEFLEVENWSYSLGDLELF